MYPENPMNPTPTDYLDQIAPGSQKKQTIIGRRPVLIGLIAAVVLIILISIFSVLSGGPKLSEKLAARLTITAETVSTATDNIKSSKLRALNTDLKLYMTNTIRDIEPILTGNNIKISKLNETLMATESDEALLSRLEDARLNAIYDRTYAREMSYKLATILNLMRQINNGNPSTTLKTFLEGAITNLAPIQEDFSSFNQATS